MGELARHFQVVAVHGVGHHPIDDGGNGHGAVGGGQVDVLGGASAGAGAHAVFAQQGAVVSVDVD
ncbi:hypothetical protein D3C71_1717090 [compost metagenome]